MSCNVCNSTHKRTLFPLESHTERARSHHDDLDGERPLFIDPASEDPRRHVRFRGPAVVAATEKGRTTIQGLGLRRSPLEEARRERLARLKDLRWIVGLEGKEGIENWVGTERIQMLAERLKTQYFRVRRTVRWRWIFSRMALTEMSGDYGAALLGCRPRIPSVTF